jgi:hypothetical protein
MTPEMLEQLLTKLLPSPIWDYVNATILAVTAGIIWWYTSETRAMRTLTQTILNESVEQNRRLFVLESQKMLIHMDQMLLDNPEQAATIGLPDLDPKDAFGYMVLNMFDIVLTEGKNWRHPVFTVWEGYCRETLANSAQLRGLVKASPSSFQPELVAMVREVEAHPGPGGTPGTT